MDLDTRSQEQDVIGLVRELVRELAPQRLKRGDVTLASRLDRDLGIDSLARTELILRIERAFRVRLSVTEVAEMESVRDLLGALGNAAPGGITAFAPDVAAHAATAPIGQPDHAKTLTEMLDWHAENHPDHLHVTVLQDENVVLGTMSYRDLQTAARAVAQGLISRDIVPGDRIAMMLPTSTDFFASFFGILYAGAVPVPIYPPARMAQLEEHMRRQIVILRNAGARALITVPEGRALAVLLRSQIDTLNSVETVATLSAERTSMPLVLRSLGAPCSTAFSRSATVSISATALTERRTRNLRSMRSTSSVRPSESIPRSRSSREASVTSPRFSRWGLSSRTSSRTTATSSSSRDGMSIQRVPSRANIGVRRRQG